MTYKLVYLPSPNQSSRAAYGHPARPTGITIHHWGVDGQRHDRVVAYLCRPGGDTSAHEVISAGRVTHLVDFDFAAWHAGTRTGNGATIGLECRPEMSAGDWKTLVERCADIEDQLGPMDYYAHRDWKATACPGRYATRISELKRAVATERARRKKGDDDMALSDTVIYRDRREGGSSVENREMSLASWFRQASNDISAMLYRQSDTRADVKDLLKAQTETNALLERIARKIGA